MGHLPSAKNPGMSSSATAPNLNLGTLGAPSSTMAGEPQPIKKKKTVKRSSTINGVSALGNSLASPSLAPSASARSSNPAADSSVPAAVPRPKAPASILSTTSGGLERRKSVRLASDTKTGEARYDNAGGPATNIERPLSPSMNGSSSAGPSQQQGILKQQNQNQQNALSSQALASQNAGYDNGEWGTRTGRDDDVSSDEGGDEYAKIRMQLNRADKHFTGSGVSFKGKGRAY